MMKHLRAASLAWLLIAGCARQASFGTESNTSSSLSQTTVPVTAPPTVPNVGEEEATTLVLAFAGRDAMGERLKGRTWFDSITVDGKSTRHDSLQLIRHFTLGGVVLDADSAHVLITYRAIGVLDRIADSMATIRTRYTDTPGNQSAEFVLARTSSGWRIARAPRTMRVFAKAYLDDPTLPDLPGGARETIGRALAAEREE